MGMRQSFEEIYKTFTSDETLLRLLYYKSNDITDNPLDPYKPNILQMDEYQRWGIINDVIKNHPTVDGLDTQPKCRILFYAGQRVPTNNYQMSDQEVVIDVIVHNSFEEVDFRSSWICDRISELLSNEKKWGIGKTFFSHGSPIGVPDNYIGYRLQYSFGSIQIDGKR